MIKKRKVEVQSLAPINVSTANKLDVSVLIKKRKVEAQSLDPINVSTANKLDVSVLIKKKKGRSTKFSVWRREPIQHIHYARKNSKTSFYLTCSTLNQPSDGET